VHGEKPKSFTTTRPTPHCSLKKRPGEYMSIMTARDLGIFGADLMSRESPHGILNSLFGYKSVAQKVTGVESFAWLLGSLGRIPVPLRVVVAISEKLCAMLENIFQSC